MLGAWPPGQLGIRVALLVEEAETLQKAQGHTLSGEQFCGLVQDVCVELAEYLADGDVPRLLIAHLEP